MNLDEQKIEFEKFYEHTIESITKLWSKVSNQNSDLYDSFKDLCWERFVWAYKVHGDWISSEHTDPMGEAFEEMYDLVFYIMKEIVNEYNKKN